MIGSIRIPSHFPSAQDLSGKIILVTGAARGLGHVIALALASAGADLAVSSRRLEAAETVAREVEGLGRRALPLVCDVTDEESATSCARRAASHFGRIDVLVNNAGVSPVFVPAHEITVEDWRAIIETNLTGAFVISRAVAPIMMEQRAGKIINTASTVGTVASPRLAAYGASKAGLIQLTRSLAADWACYNIRVNCVAPGFFESPLTAGIRGNSTLAEGVLAHTLMGRWGLSEDLGGAYVFLASDASDFVTGQAIFVDGGYSAI